jgi:GT2 family glycosyltransferase
MDLSIIIVSWRVKDKLQANLKALFQSETKFKFEVFVVDNDSRDGSMEMVRAEFSQVRLITNSDNRGFAAANNQALKLAEGKFILLLNPDMRVEGDTLEKILSWVQTNPQATVSGCKLVSVTGQIVEQVRRFPALFDQLMITWKIPHLWPGSVSKYLCTDFNYEAPAQVDSIRGAFFLINRENYYKISGQAQPLLDERYFIWFEEVDFCRQVYKLGGEVWYTPAAVCRDDVGASFRQVTLGQKQRYLGDSMLKYFQKWEPHWQYALLKVSWSLIGFFLN